MKILVLFVENHNEEKRLPNGNVYHYFPRLVSSQSTRPETDSSSGFDVRFETGHYCIKREIMHSIVAIEWRRHYPSIRREIREKRANVSTFFFPRQPQGKAFLFGRGLPRRAKFRNVFERINNDAMLFFRGEGARFFPSRRRQFFFFPFCPGRARGNVAFAEFTFFYFTWK